MMKMATGKGSPLRQGAGTGLDWFSMATGASGGGTPDLGYFLEVSGFIGIFGVGLMSRRCPSRPRGRPTRVGGGRAPNPRELLLPSLTWGPSPSGGFHSKNNFSS